MIHRLIRTVVRVMDWLDEVAIASILAALLLIFGPLVAAICFLLNHHYLAASASAGLWVLTAVACVRDFRHRRFSWVSMTLGIVWIVATLTILWVLAS